MRSLVESAKAAEGLRRQHDVAFRPSGSSARLLNAGKV